MKKATFVLLISFSFLLNYASAQDCPSISASSPANIKEGENAAFTVNISGIKQGAGATYNWSVSAGIIEGGQGTSSISVSTRGLGGQNITATVDVGGLPPQCMRSSSSTTTVDALPQAELNTKNEYTTAKLFTEDANKFAGEIMYGDHILQSPRAVIYLYPGKTATAANTIKEMTKILKASFAKYGLQSSMYSIITTGKKEKASYEMWIVPEGVKTPEPEQGM